MPADGDLAQEGPWLEALKGLEEGTNEGEKGRTSAVLCCVDDTSKFLVRWGAKSDRGLLNTLLAHLALPNIGTLPHTRRATV